MYQLLKTQQPIANDDGDDDGGGGDNNDNDDDNDDADDDNDDDNNACNNAPADDDDDNDYNVDDDKCRVYPTDSGGSPTLGSLSSMLIFQGVDNKNDGLGKMYLFSTMASFCISITHFAQVNATFPLKPNHLAIYNKSLTWIFRPFSGSDSLTFNHKFKGDQPVGKVFINCLLGCPRKF